MHKIFRIFKEDRSLVKAELAAPGRELAYVEKVAAELTVPGG